MFEANLTYGTLDATAAHRNIDPGTLATFDALVDALKSNPLVTGFDSWFYGSIAFHVSDPDKLLDGSTSSARPRRVWARSARARRSTSRSSPRAR